MKSFTPNLGKQKLNNMETKAINVGDRVELASAEASARLTNMNNGIVVKYMANMIPRTQE